LFDDYNASPVKLREAVHPAATEIRDTLFERKLAEHAPTSRNFVVFTAGGNCSGKTTIVKLSGASDAAHAVFDSTFSNTEHARRLVVQALESGKHAVIQHVHRPLHEAFQGMLERSRTEGRVVSIRQMIHSHRGAASTVRDLQRAFGDDPRVSFQFFDNSGGAPREIPALRKISDDVSGYTATRDILHAILDLELRQGRSGNDAWHKIRGSDDTGSREKIQGSRKPDGS
jgi:hypothetical protein